MNNIFTVLFKLFNNLVSNRTKISHILRCLLSWPKEKFHKEINWITKYLHQWQIIWAYCFPEVGFPKMLLKRSKSFAVYSWPCFGFKHIYNVLDIQNNKRFENLASEIPQQYLIKILLEVLSIHLNYLLWFICYQDQT